MMSLIRPLAGTIAVVALAACAGGPTSSLTSAAGVEPAAVPATAAVTVTIDGYSYKPSTIKIKAGSTVAFANKDVETHTATAVGGTFNSGFIYPHKTWTHRFNKPGTFKFYCQIHPNMVGKLVVTK